MKPEKFWDIVAKNYDKTEDHLKLIFTRIIENSIKYFNSNDKVMDFGCGTGSFAIEIASRVNKVNAIDISSKMIEIAKQKAEINNIENTSFEQVSLFNNKFKKDSFDIITAFGIIHLLNENTKIIHRIYKLLKPGGLFISSTPCLAERMTLKTKLQFYPALILSKSGLIDQCLKRFRINELQSIIQTDNFEILYSEVIFHKLTAYYCVVKKI